MASGVRRVEAKTAESARRHLNAQARGLREVAATLKTSLDDAPERLAGLVEERRRLERELADARRKLAMGDGGGGEAGRHARDRRRQAVRPRRLGRRNEGLKSLADAAKTKLGSGVVAIVGVGADGKAGVVAAVTPDLVARISAIDLVRAASETLGGKGGGGRPDMAQAGGPDGAKAEAALEAIRAVVEGKAAAA